LRHNLEKGNSEDDLKTNRFIGTVALGAGKVFNERFYLGIEGMFDFTGAKKQNSGTNGEARIGGCMPSFGLRFGFTKDTWLVYGKVSGNYTSFEMKDKASGNKVFSVNGLAPAVALGIEKSFCKKFSARLEAEYRFRNSKKLSGIDPGLDGKKFEASKGFTVRALVSYCLPIR